ncbi:hypothetical protein PM082_020278 [Marasmius tenuissimus]|nr:hypothetical protein PM082_020278 [Marasmius tenuissimus]
MFIYFPDTFNCIRNATSATLLQAADESLAQANEQLPRVPILDGPNGLMPELPSQMLNKGQRQNSIHLW